MMFFGNALKKIGIFALLLVAAPAFSFKVDTHVWIAQQVINDLRSNNNHISIPTRDLGTLIGEIDVGSAQDIINYPAYFRMGAIGPDAFPGVLEGQMIIHPGADDHRWGTGQWLRHLLSKAQPGKERAFVLGFLCHAAADIFAHTYVNTYSGGEFDPKNGYEEEERHFTLEGYISVRNPKILNEKGEFLGEAYQLVMDGNQLAVPVDFVLNHMLFGDEAISQFQGQPSSIFGAMKATKDQLDDLLRPGGKMDKMEEEIIRFIALQQAGLELNRDEARKLNELLREVQSFKDKSAEGLKKLVEITSKTLGEAQKVQGRFERAQIDLLEKTSKKSLELAHHTIQTQIKIVDLTRQLAEVVVEECVNVCETKVVEEKTCSTEKPWGCLNWIINHTTVLVFPAECAQCKALQDSGILKKKNLQKLLDKEKELYRKLQNELDKTFDEIKKAHDELINARLATLKFAETLLIEAIEQARIATSTNPLRETLKSWSQNITLVGREYIKANGQVIINTINPDASSKFKPLLDWVECQLPKAAGIPGFIPNVACATESYVSQMMESIEKIKKSALYSIPIVRDVLAFQEKIVNDVKAKVTEEALNELGKLIKVDVKHLYEILAKKVDDNELDASFMNMSHRRTKGLIVFDRPGQRMSDRVKAEMRLTESGTFNDRLYTVVANAIRLSKLSLMDGSQLHRLIRTMNQDADAHPSDMQALRIALPGAILLNAIRSIDGNHQWIQSAPSLPKVEGWKRNVCRAKRFAMQFGKVEEIHYEGCEKSGYPGFEYHEAPHHGFRLFMNPSLRNTIFNRIFTEILAPGIEAPKTLNPNFDEVLPSGYEYRVCEKQPFPTGNPNDSTCAEQVVALQLKTLHAELKIPAEVLEQVKQNVSKGTYSSLKPLFDYEAIHHKFKEENALSENELREMSRKRAAWQQDAARFRSMRENVVAIAEDVLDGSGDLRGAENQLIDIRKVLRNSYCDGRMSGHRDIKAFHAAVSASYGKLAFKGLVANIKFQDYNYFEDKAHEHVQLIEDRYATMNSMNSATQAEFNDLYVDALCKDVDVLLLHLGVSIDNAAIDDLNRELADLKKRIEGDISSPGTVTSGAEDIIRLAKSQVIDALLLENYKGALEFYTQGMAELDELERSLASPMANYKALMEAIAAARDTLAEVYQQQLEPSALKARIKKEQKEFDDNAELIEGLATPGSTAAKTWNVQASKEPADVTPSASQEDLVHILQYYIDSNKLADVLMKEIG
ncbi:zinc dependent phospholipase C family protein [Oligoflexus tunisiensis]|uniref:zinc dependent phospholipase C family protein n=1 Tax=Oligoflexus tunisiensis TaxID=708132 RepID=UPI00114C973C|nr:zinc dependent phospholipase C family protein [Oligoflexus tunisiensis]